MKSEKSASDSGKPSGEQPLRIWVLDYGVPGHFVQAAGVVKLLQDIGRAVAVSEVTFSVTLRGWLRGPMRWLLPKLPTKISWALTMKFHRDLVLPSGGVDVVIASGGTSLWLLRSLKEKTGAKSVYVGFPGSFSEDWFEIIVSPLSFPGRSQVVETPRLVTGMTPEVTAQAARDEGYVVDEEKLVAILIGGRSRSHQYEETDWLELVRALNELGESGHRFLITTSRRTGASAEEILREGLRKEFLVDAVWWSQKPRKVVKPFLGRCEQVIVTRDSLTMVSEAIDSGRPVWAAVPKVLNMPTDSKLTRYFSKLERANVLRCLPCSEISQIEPYETKDDSVQWEKSAHELALLLNAR
jgi:mitochondrial fission protein ELM1